MKKKPGAQYIRLLIDLSNANIPTPVRDKVISHFKDKIKSGQYIDNPTRFKAEVKTKLAELR